MRRIISNILVLVVVVFGNELLPTSPAAGKHITAANTIYLPVAMANNIAVQHIYLIMMENKEYTEIVANPQAPYLNSLIANFGLATNYLSIAHPSQPNYITLFSGSTQGVTSDSRYDLAATNLADQVEAGRLTWKLFAQNVPLNCYTGMTASGGEDGTSGSYGRRHNPAISFTDISQNPLRCANITDFAHFDPLAANLEFIVPNMCNSMHSCSIATGDAFLQSFIPTILNSAGWQQNGLLFITWDEGTSVPGDISGHHVATLVLTPQMTPGFTSAVPHDHYSLLRTIENLWGLGCLNNSCTANDLSEFLP